MSPTAIETFSTFGVAILCIALGIMALSLFFSLVSFLSSRGGKPETIAVRGILKNDTWATVHLSNAETFDRVKFVGFTNAASMKNQLPYELNGMVILEDESKKQFMVRAKAIRMIVVDPDQQSTAT